MKIYHFYSKTTGEIVEKFSDVVKNAVQNLIRHHFFDVRWIYSKRGF